MYKVQKKVKIERKIYKKINSDNYYNTNTLFNLT